MKIKYWMAIYPFQMNGDSNMKPMPSTQPLTEVSQGAKLVTFEVEIPDDLFGAVLVEVSNVNVDRSAKE